MTNSVLAYFDHSLDAALGILHRPWFEQQLSAHLAGILFDSSPTWHALRNVVLAAGCRIEMSKTRPFHEAAQHAWHYFENALSVYARLLFFKTSIAGVQVLTLMAFYTQNISTPCLEYMLSADAVRLAFAKGLHRAPPSTQGLSLQEMDLCNSIFWAIFCLEKQIASQSGRPSAIDDDEVTCPLPVGGDAGSALNVPYCHCLIRLAQMSSKIEKRLSTAQCRHLNLESTMRVVQQLDFEMTNIKASLHDNFGLVLGDKPTTDATGGLHLEQYLHVQYAYFTAMLSIHTVLAYPWLRALVGARECSQESDAVLQSVQVVAKTSRAAVLLTENIRFNAQTPVPVAFFGPIYALISLFVCCLSSETTQSDLAIMEIGTGYFGRIYVSTDSLISVPFVRTLTTLVAERSAPLHARDDLTSNQQGIDDEFSRLGGADSTLDVEDWCTFLRTSPADQSSHLETFL
ncbi:hypothetical protein LTR78_001780 [Recurvomyces mirabilis]|uniref:Xylanolytic transcriptional activator regulatory domain-containing protein n=1 Tax=Recurvomyces mirabilis TaxID=574656 RepID=A0AAE1C553_9PEZI|nr:hypothetical protein LTR78_001780 [Recurvomyces mirabilis]